MENLPMKENVSRTTVWPKKKYVENICIKTNSHSSIITWITFLRSFPLEKINNKSQMLHKVGCHLMCVLQQKVSREKNKGLRAEVFRGGWTFIGGDQCRTMQILAERAESESKGTACINFHKFTTLIYFIHGLVFFLGMLGRQGHWSLPEMYRKTFNQC